ncbi:MAG: cobyrinate a,c-diamide synthase, partial [Thermoproteota archaeon]|nr:cobyrinate a,c-diamide synthase [Thermoproteota archaeon]
MQVPRIILAGVTSGVGKTSVALGVMQGLSKRGFKVQPFKVGPDFIDPSYHSFITKRKSHNLDVWLMGQAGLLQCFATASHDADIAVVEGVMGLYDGLSGKNNFASTAHVAKILDAPVILIVDASKGARSIAAVILGFLHFDRKLRIAAVILNKVAGERHARYITDAIEAKIKIPVVGVIYRNSEIHLEERHLGLIPATELDTAKGQMILKTAKYIAECIETDRILGLCSKSALPDAPDQPKRRPARVRIGIALDESFNFYYVDNLVALQRCGAQLVYFSPVNDKKLPDELHGLIIGGGFPEVLADKLESNKS